MADTRCANTEYQLEVDILMIEYVLYKAIQAQLHLLNLSIAPESQHRNGDGESHFANEAAASVTRLTETYDSKPLRSVFATSS